jgi:hypothetical protein
MGSTPRASPQDSLAAVAGVDSLPGKDAPAALLEMGGASSGRCW